MRDDNVSVIIFALELNEIRQIFALGTTCTILVVYDDFIPRK